MTPERALPPELLAAALRERMRKGERLELPVVTGSMEPVVPVGARIDLEPVADLARLRRFDIVLFADGDKLICHYFWHLNSVPGPRGHLLVTRSLAGGEDFPFPEERFVGRVRSHRIPAARRARLVLRALRARWRQR